MYWQRDLGKMAKIADSSFSKREGTSFTRGGNVLHKRRVRLSQEEATSFTRGGYVLHKRRVRPSQEKGRWGGPKIRDRKKSKIEFLVMIIFGFPASFGTAFSRHTLL